MAKLGEQDKRELLPGEMLGDVLERVVVDIYDAERRHKSAERCVLGALMISNRRLSDVDLVEQHFSEIAHKLAFRAIWAVIFHGDVANPLSVAEWLRAEGYENPPDEAFLAQLVLETPCAEHARDYADLVRF